MTVGPVNPTGGVEAAQTTVPDLPVPPPVVAGSKTGGVTVPPSGSQPHARGSFAAHLERVQGHSYARIESGPQRGLYVNQSGNARNGEVFRLEIRDGREYHVYGAGADALVVGLPPRQHTTAASESRPSANPIPTHVRIAPGQTYT